MHYAVCPPIGEKELADANWFDYWIIGHEDPIVYNPSKPNEFFGKLVREFYSQNETLIEDRYDDDNASVNAAFKTFIEGHGYTVITNTAQLQWITV
jgi:hypothetical protein